MHFLGFDIHLEKDDHGDVVSIDQYEVMNDFLAVNKAKPVKNIASPMTTNHIDPNSPKLSDEEKAER